MDFKSVMEEMASLRMLEPIDLMNFFDEYKETLDFVPSTDADIQTGMGLDNEPERFNIAREKCSLEHLYQPDDATVLKYMPGQIDSQRVQLTDIPLGGHKLKTFKALIENKELSQRNPFRRSNDIYKLAPFPKDNAPVAPDKECPYYKDLLITIRIYRPTRAIHIGRTLEKPVFAEQFQCLGSNLLTDLREKISCICNKYHFFDISDDPNAPLPEKRTDPGFFFITDTFYNDKRNRQNADYSAVILRWAKATPCFRTAKFKVAKMEETRLIDLTVSLGFPQLYQHHGNCEHLFTFSQVEVFTPALTYNQTVSHDLYPRLHSFGIYNNRLCNMCGMVHYVYAVEHSDRQLHDPAYLCNNCFHSFHYDDGKKVGEFRAYRFQDFGESNITDIQVDDMEEKHSGNEAGKSAKKNNKRRRRANSARCQDDNYSVIYNEMDKQVIVVRQNFS